MSHLYRLHGLTVASDVVLEAEPSPAPAAPADLTVLRGGRRRVPAELPDGLPVAVLETPEQGLRHAVVQVEDGWIIRFPRVADVELDRHLTTATTHPAPETPEGLLAVLVAGFVIASVLQLRGDAVLHASAVEVGGRALAVVGPSGTGKSTTATLLCTAGARLVSDDVLRLELDGGSPRTWRGPASTRLRAQAASLVTGAATTSADGRTVARQRRSAADEMEVAAVLLPRPRRDLAEVRVVALSGLAALLPLVSAPRVLGWCDPTSLARQLEQVAALCAAVPVAEVHMPWGPPFPPGLGQQVLTALGSAHELGLAGVPASTA